MNRDQAIGLMIKLEGGYVNNPTDPGGRTKFGITQATLNAVRTHIVSTVLPADVFNLTEDQAYAIYRAVDWAEIRGDDLPATLAPLVLNAAVNEGEGTAVKLLQECLHVSPDGVMGPATVAAVKSWHSSYLPEQTLAEEYAAHVGVRYASLYAREGQFELGWLRRLMRVYTLALGLP